MLETIWGQPVTSLKYEDRFNNIRKRLTKEQDDAIVAEIEADLNSTPIGSAAAARWLASKNKGNKNTGMWADTPRMPIFELLGEDHDASRSFFGKFYRWVVIHRPELWRFVKQPIPGGDEDEEYTQYWRVT